MGCEHVIDRKAEGYRFWSDEHTQDEKEWRRLGKDIREPDRRGPRHRVRAPGPPDHGRVGVRRQRGGKIVTCAATSRLHDRVRQPPPLDEAEEHRRPPLRQLPRGVGGEPADRPRARSSRCCPRCTRSTDVGEAACRSTTTCTRARSACCASRPRRVSASTIPSCEHDRRGQDHAVPPPRLRRVCSSSMTHATGARRARHAARHAADRDRPRRHRGAATSTRPSTTTADLRRRGRAPRGRRAATASRRRCSRWPTATSSSLTPTRDDSPVAKYLEKKGEGLHHVGYRVDDCAAALDAMVAAGPRRSTRRRGPGQPRHDRRVRPPEGRVRHPHRARPGVTLRP